MTLGTIIKCLSCDGLGVIVFKEVEPRKDLPTSSACVNCGGSGKFKVSVQGIIEHMRSSNEPRDRRKSKS